MRLTQHQHIMIRSEITLYQFYEARCFVDYFILFLVELFNLIRIIMLGFLRQPNLRTS